MEQGYYLDDKGGKRLKPCKARIRIGNGQRINIERFATEAEARAAYVAAQKICRGSSRSPGAKTSNVYLVQNSEGLIKVGKARYVRSRLHKIQVDNSNTFLGKKLVICPFQDQGRPFVVRLTVITPQYFVFVGANGMKSIYARSAIASVFDKGEMG